MRSGALTLLAASCAAALVSGCSAESPAPMPRVVAEEDAAEPASASGLTSIAGTPLHLEVLGSGAETVVVPLGFFLEDAFRSRPELLRERQWVFYDPRDRGRSAAVAETVPLGTAEDVADLERLRQYLGVERMALVGFSSHAEVVIRYALEHPERVSRIVLLGAPSRVDGTLYPPHLRASDRLEAMGPEAVREVQQLQIERLHETGPREYCEREWRVTRRALVGDPELAVELSSPCHLEREWPLHLYRHLERVSAAKSPDPGLDRLAALERPVLVIHGTRDRNAAYGAGRQWALELGNARLLTLEGAAHWSWIDAPDAVFGAIADFLDGSWPGPSEVVERLDPRVDPDAEI